MAKSCDAPRSCWPHELGSPSVTGSSNDLRYAHFASEHRPAADGGQQVKIYDTGGKPISGFSSSDGKTQPFDTEDGSRKFSSLKLL